MLGNVNMSHVAFSVCLFVCLLRTLCTKVAFLLSCMEDVIGIDKKKRQCRGGLSENQKNWKRGLTDIYRM